MKKKVIELCLNDKVKMVTPLGTYICKVTSLTLREAYGVSVMVGVQPVDYHDGHFSPFMDPNEEIEVVED